MRLVNIMYRCANFLCVSYVTVFPWGDTLRSCNGRHHQKTVFNPVPFPINLVSVPQENNVAVSDLVYRGEHIYRLLDLVWWELTVVLCVNFDASPWFKSLIMYYLKVNWYMKGKPGLLQPFKVTFFCPNNNKITVLLRLAGTPGDCLLQPPARIRFG